MAGPTRLLRPRCCVIPPLMTVKARRGPRRHRRSLGIGLHRAVPFLRVFFGRITRDLLPGRTQVGDGVRATVVESAMPGSTMAWARWAFSAVSIGTGLSVNPEG
jgi:hypothetical protein